MSADVESDVNVDDYFGETREYYVTGYVKLILTVHTPEGVSYDLDGYFDNVWDAEDWINNHNQEFVEKQEQEEYERLQEEEEAAQIREEQQIEDERMERHSLL